MVGDEYPVKVVYLQDETIALKEWLNDEVEIDIFVTGLGLAGDVKNLKTLESSYDELKRNYEEREEKLVKSEKALKSKQEEINKMAKQMEENQQKKKESAPIKRLEDLQDNLGNSFKRLEEYQNEENKLANSIPRLIIGKLKFSVSD